MIRFSLGWGWRYYTNKSGKTQWLSSLIRMKVYRVEAVWLEISGTQFTKLVDRSTSLDYEESSLGHVTVFFFFSTSCICIYYLSYFLKSRIFTVAAKIKALTCAPSEACVRARLHVKCVNNIVSIYLGEMYETTLCPYLLQVLRRMFCCIFNMPNCESFWWTQYFCHIFRSWDIDPVKNKQSDVAPPASRYVASLSHHK